MVRTQFKFPQAIWKRIGSISCILLILELNQFFCIFLQIFFIDLECPCPLLQFQSQCGPSHLPNTNDFIDLEMFG